MFIRGGKHCFADKLINADVEKLGNGSNGFNIGVGGFTMDHAANLGFMCACFLGKFTGADVMQIKQ